MTDAIHYLSLTLSNVRAFGEQQTLNLSKDGRPAPWSVIIGENGVGKTTLLQALAAMRPVPAIDDLVLSTADVLGDEAPIGAGAEAGTPDCVAPALADYENARIESLVRHGSRMAASLTVEMESIDGETFTFGYDVATDDGGLQSAAPRLARRTLASKGPLVIAYSAFRHAGHSNLSTFEDLEPTEALFEERIQLVDPDEVAERIDYNVLSADRDSRQGPFGEREQRLKDRARWENFQNKMREAISALIPDLSPEDVTLEVGGIHVRTPSGIVPLAKLSLGAQTTVAWLVDLAWRLRTKFPESDNPFEESAIVLIDEVELHLHPIWQRSLRGQLLRHFPRIQFIVSTHAPVTAQESIAANDPVSIIRWEGDHSVIVPHPLPTMAVRLDDVATTVFDLETSLPSRLEKLLEERRDLIRKIDLTVDEKGRLLQLSRVALAVQSGSIQDESDIELLMAGSANDARI